MRWKIVLTIAITFLISISEASAETWNGIYPLKSTRSDVEKIMGKCKSDVSWLCVYELEDKFVFINYYDTDEGCNGLGLWDVPKETVTEFRIMYKLEKRPTISDLKIDLKEFDQKEDSDLAGQIVFSNRAKGVSFVAENEVVKAFYYMPTEKEETLHKCKQLN